jgi:hypothetical protein
MPVIRILLVAAVVALATWFLGWWSVPLTGAVYALLRRGEDHAVLEAALGAMLAWGALLAWQTTNPAYSRLSAAISGVFPVPAVVLMVVAVLFAGLLAGAAARLTHES